MPLTARADSGFVQRGLAVWRIAVWLLLLLAAFGCLQYVSHAQWLWSQWANVPVANRGVLYSMLAWDAGYFAAAFALIVLCAGCILRQGWALTPLRVACGVLALWLLVSGGMMLVRWAPFERASADALAQLGNDVAMRNVVLHARRVYRITLVLKAAAIPLVLWLAWRLGLPAVRAQFRWRR